MLNRLSPRYGRQCATCACTLPDIVPLLPAFQMNIQDGDIITCVLVAQAGAM